MSRREIMVKKSTRILILACFVFLLFPVLLLSQEAQSIAGHWEGSIDVPGNKLEILIDFSQKPDDSWEGKISIPAQNAKNLPLDNISLVNKDASFVITGVPGEPTFKGTVSEDGTNITGDFTQGGTEF